MTGKKYHECFPGSNAEKAAVAVVGVVAVDGGLCSSSISFCFRGNVQDNHISARGRFNAAFRL